jgi:hypothetical protein
MAFLEILDIAPAAPPSPALWGHAIDAPVAGERSESCVLRINGWALGKEAAAQEIQVESDFRLIRRTPVNIARPGVQEHFAHVPGAENSGFDTLISLIGLPLEFELTVRVVLQDKRRLPLRLIRGRRQPLSSPFQGGLRPLMVTSLGRTGTTWLMRLLSEHPRIVAYWEYPYELRAANYWMHMVKVLSEPANPYEFSTTNFWANRSCLVSHPFFTSHLIKDPLLEEFFGRVYVESLAGFCQGSTDAFYRRVAESQGRSNVLYYAEKYHSGSHLPWVLWEFCPGVREVVLTRDPRDMVCSILAFNAKRGFAAFGREHARSDEQFIKQLRSDVEMLLRSWKSRADRAHLLRYEDLILTPETTLADLLRYLDLEADGGTIADMLEKASRETPELQGHRTSSDPRSSIGRWQRDLSPELKELCQATFGPVLAELGYT